MIERRVSFFVKGIPISQGSKYGRVVAGRAIMTEGFGDRPKMLKAWRYRVAATAMEWRLTSDEGKIYAYTKDTVIDLHCHFYLPRGKTVKRISPTTKPDCSKLVRAVEDALTKVLYVDDAQVCRLVVTKDYASPIGNPGVQIDIVAREV